MNCRRSSPTRVPRIVRAIVAAAVTISCVACGGAAPSGNPPPVAEQAISELIARNIKIAVGEGELRHELILSRIASSAVYRQCDVTATVFYDNGKTSQTTRFFHSWEPLEQKTIAVPPEGTIVRVELTGAVTVFHAPTPTTGDAPKDAVEAQVGGRHHFKETQAW